MRDRTEKPYAQVHHIVAAHVRHVPLLDLLLATHQPLRKGKRALVALQLDVVPLVVDGNHLQVRRETDPLHRLQNVQNLLRLVKERLRNDGSGRLYRHRSFLDRKRLS